MGGNGTIGGGKSAELKFLIKEKMADPDSDAKQNWKGTDSYVGESFTVTITTPDGKQLPPIPVKKNEKLKIEWS
ncbi:MAG: hypothetical protein ACRD2Y_14870 [Terriglobales bacterium]